MIGRCLREQLQAIHVFASATGSHRFLSEFIEMDGIWLCLEVVGLENAKDDDKTNAVKVLECVADAGSVYKELICEHHGIILAAECMGKARNEETINSACHFLLLLSKGNPNYVQLVYHVLIQLLESINPFVQRVACRALRDVQQRIGPAIPDLVAPLFVVMRTLDQHLHGELRDFICELMQYDIRSELITRLIGLLVVDTDLTTTAHGDKNDIPLAMYTQQAAAAKTIHILAEKSHKIAEEFVQNNVTHSLLAALGTANHHEGRNASAQTLAYFIDHFAKVRQDVYQCMGPRLFQKFVENLAEFPYIVSEVEADMLATNKVGMA